MENCVVRPTCYDGVLYYNDKDQLEQFIKGIVTKNATPNFGRPFVIIVPDSNYLIASDIYGASYSQILPYNYDTVIILAQSLRNLFNGIGYPLSNIYETPFGELEVDIDDINILKNVDDDYFVEAEKYHLDNRSIELQLPFIHSILKNVKIVPLLIGYNTTVITTHLSRSIKYLIEKNSFKKYLVVVVANLSTDMNLNNTIKMDKEFVDVIKKMDADLLAEKIALGTLKTTNGSGLVTMLRVMNSSGINYRCNFLDYQTSSDITEDRDKVEGYLSMSFTKFE